MLGLLCPRLDLAVRLGTCFAGFLAEALERRERYFASAPELIVMPAALSSALKALTLTRPVRPSHRSFAGKCSVSCTGPTESGERVRLRRNQWVAFNK